MIKLATILALFATPAAALQCAPKDVVRSHLAAKFKEQRTGSGLSGQFIMEVWSGADGSWTVLRISADGLACVMAAGQEWRDHEREPEGTDG